MVSEKEKAHRAAIRAALDKHPDDNVDLIDVEVQHQRELTSKKVSSAYTRATLLIGAAGVLGGVSGGAILSSAANWTNFVSVILYVSAAIFGLLALRPMSGDDLKIDDAVLGGVSKSVKGLQRSFISSRLIGIREYERTVKVRTRLVVLGFVLLLAAWGLSAAGTALAIVDPAEPDVTHVIIDEE